VLDPCRVRLWQNLGDFRQKRALRVIFLARGEDHRHVQNFRHLGQRNRLFGGKLTVDILDQLHGTNLMVDQQQSGSVSTKFFVFHRFRLTK